MAAHRMNLLQLPPEILLDIAELLPQAGVLSLRAACRPLLAVGDRLVMTPQRLSRIYLHPSSIQRVLNICEYSTHREKVTELVLLGKAPGDSNRYDVYDPVIYLKDKPWPQFAAKEDQNEPQSLTDLVRIEHTPFHATYGPLIAALGKLPNLRSAVYAPFADQEGLNMVSHTTMNSWAQAHADYGGSYGGPGQRSLSYAKRKIQWSDCEVLVGLLTQLPDIASLHLRQEINGFLSHSARYDWLVLSGPTHGITGRLSFGRVLPYEWIGRAITSMDFCVDTATTQSGPYHIAFAGNILRYSRHLKVLTVRIDNTRAPGSSERERSMDFLAITECLPELDSINIIGIGALPSTLFTGIQGLGLSDELNRRAPFGYFLRLHRDSLRTINLSNVAMAEYRALAVKAGMRDGLTYMAQQLHKLGNAIIVLRQAKCCHVCIDFIGQPRAGQCCQAALTGNGVTRRSRIKASIAQDLATELGVEERDGVWNFGEHVMRRVEEMREETKAKER